MAGHHGLDYPTRWAQRACLSTRAHACNSGRGSTSIELHFGGDRFFDDRLKLRLNSIGYFGEDGRRDFGKTMHDIISNVKTLEDIPHAVDRKIREGELPEEERENKVKELSGFLSLPEVSEWYSGKYTVLNETQLLHPRGRFTRPDRVMLGEQEVIVADYKFGESIDDRYNRQVQGYMATIRSMGYGKVKGFLYVKLGVVQEVK